MITDVVIDRIDAAIFSREKIDSFNHEIRVRGADFNHASMTLYFSWDVIYGPDTGYLKLEGRAVSMETPETMKHIKAEWEHSKTIPMDFIKRFSNELNYFCTLNSAFILRPMNMNPPIKLPEISTVREK